MKNVRCLFLKLHCMNNIGLKLLFWMQIIKKDLTIVLRLSCHFLTQSISKFCINDAPTN